ncbi:gliding motility-associated C-terminal domain-containing protein [uncultured Draconibacterium sp.]|uniref:gliding motility-associated C-terminal domain-containing protein n=1 Tax=uncultured Draconibacterium sp. TaxID=1573823 RepID=UPI002AA86AAA|nr:gliding motility-associated C-terminal domain-containing protein [uncultured Draconibacterium sp.]
MAGEDFTITCTENIGGKVIGEDNDATASYSWSPALGLSSTTVSNPTANPSVTTTYTVTKTDLTSGCFDTDEITVTVDSAATTAVAGEDFTITCTENIGGKVIGEDNDATASYSWSPALGLSSTTVSNPTANPSVTTTYTVTKTDLTSGCFDTDEITVTVDSIVPTAKLIGNLEICSDEQTILDASSSITQELAIYMWFKDNILLADQEGDTLVVTQSGEYVVEVTDSRNGCTDSDTVIVVVNEVPSINPLEDLEICDSITLTELQELRPLPAEFWYYAETGGIDSIQATISKTQDIYIYAATGSDNMCWTEDTFTVSIEYTPEITNPGTQTACDSYTLPTIQGTNLTGNEAYYNNSRQNNGIIITGPITSSQTVWIYDSTAYGCSDEEMFTVTILDSPEDTIDVTACDQYELNDSIYTESGTYTQVIEGEGGCVGTITVNLTILESTEEVINQVVCDSYTLNDRTYTESGTYRQFTTNDAGCSHTIILNLTVREDVIELTSEASDLTVECDGFGNADALENWLNSNGITGAAEVGFGGITWTNDFEALTPGCCNTGAAIVTFTAIDDCGNTVSTTATFTIIDTTAPTFTAPEDITIYSDSECNYDVSVEVTGDVTDESDACCTDLNAEYSDIQEQGSCAGEWIITRTWTLVDECGNEAEPQVQIITILDTVAPVISCNDITVQLNENGVASITVDDINGGSTDNCGIDTMYISQEFFYCGGLGENQVTLTAIDECGNVSTCTSTVTVEEGVYECDPELYKANADYLELIYCPGGTVTGDIDLFANDEGFTRENSDFGVLTNLPEGVTITDGTLDYINEDASELIITLTYSVCHNLNTSICDTAEVTIRVLIDTDCDDIPDVNDIDDDDDGILDVDEELYALNQETLDSDGDGIVDRLDIDSDNDGIPDNIEWQQTIAEGAEAERRGGTDNNWDYYPPLGSDSNGDGWDDQYDTENEGVYYEPLDMDQDGTPDYLDIDSDGDGIEDWIEGWDAAPHDTIADTNIGSTDADGDGLFDPYDSYDTSEEWLHGQNAIGSYAPLQDMAADTANNIRDWRDIIDPPVITDPQEAEGCELIIPDGFSPNEDGYNDYFEMRFVCAEGEQTFEELYPEARIEIFNRWGNQVYEQENYGNVTRWGSTDAWWNGTSMHDMQIGNDKLPAATYFYILYFNSGGKEPVTGTIFLNN